MTSLMALSITTGILCGIWSQFSAAWGLIGWAGFAACTTFFACGQTGLKGVAITVRQNLFGVLCGMAIIMLTDMFPFPGTTLVFGGLVTFVMCIAGSMNFLAFIPGTFMGSFATFAANGDYKMLIPSLLAGAILGISCDASGKWLYSKVGKPEEEINEKV